MLRVNTSCSFPRPLKQFPVDSLEELILHALKALRETIPPDSQPGLTAQNTAIGFLGKDLSFRELGKEEDIQIWLDRLPPMPTRPMGAAAGGTGEGEGASTSTPVDPEGSTSINAD